MVKKIFSVITWVGLFMLVTTNSYADRRSYVWTYEYLSMPKGKAEVEYYFTNQIADASISNINKMKHWLEFEYGITDHWDVAMYQMLLVDNKQAETNSGYDGFKVRTRYRFGDKGQYWLDPLIYLEYIRDDDFSTPNVLEEKLVLAKDIGKFNFSYNQILEIELESAGKSENEYAFGASYNFNNTFKFGLESKGSYTKDENYVGPTISWGTSKLWANLGVAWGVTKKSDDLQIRAIVGVPF